MPWMSIIMWLVSFLASKSSGASTTKSALIATGAGLATYYLADPANKDNVLGVTMGDDKATTGSTTEVDGGSTKLPTPSFGSTAVSEVGSTLRNWGATGTLAVVAGTSALASGGLTKYWPWIALAAGAFILTR